MKPHGWYALLCLPTIGEIYGWCSDWTKCAQMESVHDTVQYLHLQVPHSRNIMLGQLMVGSKHWPDNNQHEPETSRRCYFFGLGNSRGNALCSRTRLDTHSIRAHCLTCLVALGDKQTVLHLLLQLEWLARLFASVGGGALKLWLAKVRRTFCMGELLRPTPAIDCSYFVYASLDNVAIVQCYFFPPPLLLIVPLPFEHVFSTLLSGAMYLLV